MRCLKGQWMLGQRQGIFLKMTTTCAVERISSVWSRNKIEGKNIIHNRPLFTKSVFVCRRKKCVTAKIHSSLHQGEWLAFGLPFYFASFWWIWPSGAVPNFVWAKQRKMDREVGMMAMGKSRKLHTRRTRTQSKAFPSRSSCLDTKLIFYRVYVCVEGRRCLLRSHSTGNMLIYTATCASASSHFRATSCTRPSSCPAKCKLMILRSQAWK